MTEEEAKAWVAARYPERAALVEAVVDAVVEESANQNLIAASSVPAIWARHVVDSAQLLNLAAGRDGVWVDIGTGGGFPGLIVAALRDAPVVMIEPRRKRAEFLQGVVDRLEMGGRARVVASKVEAVRDRASVVTARAVASIEGIFAMSSKIADADTRFLLQRGRSARADLDDAARSWRGVFHVEQSLTDPESVIVVAEKVARR